MSKKSKLSLDQVEHVGALANLKLGPKEIKKFQAQLEAILSYVERLDEVKTEKVEPTSQITGLENVFRQDIPQPSLNQEEVLSQASKKHNNLFMVEAILDET